MNDIIIKKQTSYLDNWKKHINIGTRNNGLYEKNNEILLERDNDKIPLYKIKQYIIANKQINVFPKLFGIYEINNKYYYHSEKLDYDLLRLLMNITIRNIISNNKLNNKLINIFELKRNRLNIFNVLSLKIYIHNKLYNNSLLKQLNFIFNTKNIYHHDVNLNGKNINIKKSDFEIIVSNQSIIQNIINIINNNTLTLIEYKQFLDLLTNEYNIIFIKIIKEIVKLLNELLKNGYFCSDYHKFENFGIKLINGVYKYYIIDWEYIDWVDNLDKFNFNDDLNNNNPKLIKFIESLIHIANKRKFNKPNILSSLFQNLDEYKITDNELNLIGINNDMINILKDEYNYINKTPLICKNNDSIKNKYKQILEFINH